MLSTCMLSDELINRVVRTIPIMFNLHFAF
jgi:hypothetical protein